MIFLKNKINAQIDKVCRDVMVIMGWDMEKATVWCTAENPNFGGMSPIDMILLGRYKKLQKFIDNAREENRCP